jgi:hypothetical protein
MSEAPKSPIDVACRHCDAPVGHKCGTRPSRAILRRRAAAGDPIGNYWIRELSYFHRTRWTDFNRIRGERAALADWNAKYGGATA